ncbi:DNA-binding transcriptional LysR family regulator [Amycolatopsis endophytica]|uniref:DNA-binding transcriptional LysR family regulator n=1 Tax=Amycolatopsis endophytica TaxID=860233 RepID=A0A853BE89_9PSEU|nr:DNA-binding transcriptional LysR family regulator [Amycolatopsis endophytica]
MAVAEERHFTRAARRLMVSQSGLSASIRTLERELGGPLFVRSTRRVELTEIGRAVLTDARRAIAGAEAAKQAAAEVQGLVRGVLAVGTEQCIGVVDVPGALAKLHAAHPRIEIRLRHSGSADLMRELVAGQLDVAFVAGDEPVQDSVRTVPLAAEPMVLLTGPRHPLATVDVPAWSELSAETFVDFHRDWSIRQVTDHAFAEQGLTRRVALEVNDVHSLLDLVRCELGVAIVPRPVAMKDKAAGLVSRPLPGEVLWRVSLAVGDGAHASPAARAFCALCGALTAE